mmetsp:Transcript_14966/g.26913  ORF Transcript_14966/g.26913 Transcript_14966/m.26913 type:complete len:217 (+) Transcript_14966:126-776(+)|eukprot:CAMPEP_0197529738 /NCGR_PEP_ID=MMETSP1318-20131121/29446_1 /TAXON_ID=552666 /ORGANISM="Partenskyella glossopodia, Strain RCC365" /LENGTH=216 /DNA_ID=CAMNT_0043085317 /DNA_START=64 /DNA_END=714 /DNA_ORIENTATION=+
MTSVPKESKQDKPAEKKSEKHHICVCVDESEHGEKLIEWVAKNMKGRGDKCTMIHVYDYTPIHVVPGPGFALAGMNITEMNNDIRKAARREGADLLKRYSQIAKNNGLTFDELKLLNPTDHPKRTILAYTDKYNPTILICASRGMGAVGRMFLGSTSDFLVHNCKCSVMIVKLDVSASTTKGGDNWKINTPATDAADEARDNNDKKNDQSNSTKTE